MKTCSISSCDRKLDARGYCSTHYWQYKNWGYVREHVEPRNKRGSLSCSVGGCGGPYHSKGFCGKHYQQRFCYGGIKNRTVHDRNEIKVVGELAYISLYDRSNNPINTCIVDAADVPLVAGIKWHVSGPLNYVRSQVTGIHNVIAAAPVVDHINGDPLDNRRSNLRAATVAENNQNTSRKNSKTSSQYKGVFRDHTTKKPWKASICGITIGRFADEIEAAWMYDQWSLSLFGEFARTNLEYHISHSLPS